MQKSQQGPTKIKGFQFYCEAKLRMIVVPLLCFGGAIANPRKWAMRATCNYASNRLGVQQIPCAEQLRITSKSQEKRNPLNANVCFKHEQCGGGGRRGGLGEARWGRKTSKCFENHCFPLQCWYDISLCSAVLCVVLLC